MPTMMIISTLALLLLRVVQLRPKPRRRTRRRWVLIVRSHLGTSSSFPLVLLLCLLLCLLLLVTADVKGGVHFLGFWGLGFPSDIFFFEKTLFVSLDLKISYTRCDILIMIEDTFRSNISLY